MIRLPTEILYYICNYLHIIDISSLKITCSYMNYTLVYNYPQVIVEDKYVADYTPGWYRPFINFKDGIISINRPVASKVDMANQYICVSLQSIYTVYNTYVPHGICRIKTVSETFNTYYPGSRKSYTLITSTYDYGVLLQRYIIRDKSRIFTEERVKCICGGMAATIYAYDNYIGSGKYHSITYKCRDKKYTILHGIYVGSFEIYGSGFTAKGIMNNGILFHYKLYQYNEPIYECLITDEVVKEIHIGANNNINEKIINKKVYYSMGYKISIYNPITKPYSSDNYLPFPWYIR